MNATHRLALVSVFAFLCFVVLISPTNANPDEDILARKRAVFASVESQSFDAPLSASARITITANGFTPTVLSVISGTQVIWYNATSQTQVLQSGELYHIYLPLVMRSAMDASFAAEHDQTLSPATTLNNRTLCVTIRETIIIDQLM
jgi:hypothetical protein